MIKKFKKCKTRILYQSKVEDNEECKDKTNKIYHESSDKICEILSPRFKKDTLNKMADTLKWIQPKDATEIERTCTANTCGSLQTKNFDEFTEENIRKENVKNLKILNPNSPAKTYEELEAEDSRLTWNTTAERSSNIKNFNIKNIKNLEGSSEAAEALDFSDTLFKGVKTGIQEMVTNLLQK